MGILNTSMSLDLKDYGSSDFEALYLIKEGYAILTGSDEQSNRTMGFQR